MVLAGDAVAKVNKPGASLDALDACARAEERGGGKREVALAATHVGDVDFGLGVPKPRLAREAGQQLGEFVYLVEFCRHARARVGAVVCDAERAQPRRAGGNRVIALAVVGQGRGGGGGGGGGFFPGGFQVDSRGAAGRAFKPDGLCHGEQMRVEEIGADEFFEERERGLRRVVFGDVVCRVAVDKAQARAGLEGDGADVDVFERGIRAAVFAQGELDQRAIGDGGVEQPEEADARGGMLHGQEGQPARARNAMLDPRGAMCMIGNSLAANALIVYRLGQEILNLQSGVRFPVGAPSLSQSRRNCFENVAGARRVSSHT